MTEPFIWPEHFRLMEAIASKRPVIHCITNYVTARDVANPVSYTHLTLPTT